MPNSPHPEAAQLEQQARKAFEEDPHYLTSVTQMADLKQVVTREAVFAANGIKLIDKGIAIGSGLRERLLKHVLLKPIDQSLEVKGGVDAEALAQDAASLVAKEPFLQRLLGAGEASQACQRALSGMALPEQLGFKLTVMREQLPWLYRHVLTVALLGHFLAQRLQLSPQQCHTALLAGLMHDLGELHTDPALLDRRHRMSHEELHYVDVHPISGYLIAREILGAQSEVATAILHHHEKLDGSGYPHCLRGQAIGQLARIIALADTCASIIIRFRGSERLRVLMRLNRQKLDPVLIALLHGELDRIDDADPAESPGIVQVQAATQLLQRWTELSATWQGRQPQELNFLFERFATLRFMLVQFGLNPDDLQSMQALIGEPELAGELGAAFDEVRWQIADLGREIQRRCEAIGQILSGADNALIEACLSEIQIYLLMTAPQERAPESERRRKGAA
ncbi:cyclic di-GMP phosphodiesterase response regulator RpfG [mine drainage metagenome]|uniref:Cyclic di-GMP phosphodiesterase response regulator RpfG n=1 Tax=mine drainage metagenome TaxID=410659 RepID=A0A1J5R695_9ZZZZ